MYIFGFGRSATGLLQRELCGIKHVFTKREIKDFRNLVELRKAGRVGPTTL